MSAGRRWLLSLGAAIAAWPQASVHADAPPHYLSVASCGLRPGDAARWHADHRLDEAAALWSRGASLHEAVERTGYVAGAVSGIHIENLDAAQRPALGASTCRALRDDALRDSGSFERGGDAWIVLAAPVALPAAGDAARVGAQALELVNRLRRSPQRCGARLMPAADPLRLSDRLAEAAAGHARDMARQHYFEHQDRSGHTPADRVRATGYRDRRVGENIARGRLSTEDAIAGWRTSPGHCENLMDPEFTEMGIAYASEPGTGGEVYWVQVLAAPR
ncbi:MAG: CAP domain-containing protein [Proteobacteria bacterium]|nr:CAP domain-containing protein [Pseudomonadota bacterium]